MMNIKPMRLILMARKWRNTALVERRQRIFSPSTRSDHDHHQQQLVADKGHFIVYTNDSKRFMVPIKYLHSDIFKELFRMSEETYGLPRNGPITLPCDAVFMEYVISVLMVSRRSSRQWACKDMAAEITGELLTSSFVTASSSHHQQDQAEERMSHRQWLLHGF